MLADYKSFASYGDQDSIKTTRFILALFWVTILFQVTGLKYIWSFESLSRIVNLLVLLIMLIYAIKVIGGGHYLPNIWYYYLIPGILIFAGMFLNICINAYSNIKLVGYFGLTLPWLTYLLIPAFLKRGVINSDKLWRYYYCFMLISNIFGIIDYNLALSNVLNLREIHTQYGNYLGGIFSWLHMSGDGSPGYRYYSCFLEPGTAAMFLLPAMTYAFFNKKYVGLIIFLVAFSLTFSLGGLISLLFLIIIVAFMHINRSKKYLVYAILASLIITVMLWIFFGESIIKKYKEKDISATTREENFINAIIEFPVMSFNNPLGLKLEEDTKSFEKNRFYIGTNFMPGFYLQYGGISAFFGYLICLFVSLSITLRSIKKPDLILEEKVVFSSILVLFPFIFQRPTIWESALFAFLFAPSLIRFIERINKQEKASQLL